MAIQKQKQNTKHPKQTSSPPRVALVVETSTAFGRKLLCGVAAYIRENGPWSVYFGERSSHDAVPQWLKNWKGDGIISRIASPKIVDLVAGMRLPVVDLNEQLAGFGVPLISNDHAAVGRMAARHLLDRGFNTFGYVGHSGLFWSDRRGQEFMRTVREDGCSCEEYPGKVETVRTLREATWELEMDAIGAWLKSLPKPAGVMASDDFRALQLLAACRRADVGVPEEVAVIGVGADDIACELADPPLSSVILNAWRMGYESAAMLDRLMRTEQAVNTELVIAPLDVACRQSTDITAIADALVAKAMRFIREHACEGINVEDVLAHLVVSRTCLQDRFRKVVRRSIHDVIVDARISRVKDLLAQTDLSVPDIAERTGFRYAEYMSSTLKQRTGWSPMAYRQQHGRKAEPAAT